MLTKGCQQPVGCSVLDNIDSSNTGRAAMGLVVGRPRVQGRQAAGRRRCPPDWVGEPLCVVLPEGVSAALVPAKDAVPGVLQAWGARGGRV
jgi:hypothetical protein